MESVDLPLYDYYGSDPLAKFLVMRWKIRPLGLAQISLLFGTCYMGLLAAAFGFLLPRPGIVASGVDIFNLVNFFLIFPIIAYYYLAQPAKIHGAYTALIQQVGEQGDWQAEFRPEMDVLAKHRGWLMGSLALGIFVIITGAYDSSLRLGEWWYAANVWMVIGLQAARGIVVFMIMIVFCRHIVTSIGLGRIYKRFEVLAPILPPSGTHAIRAVADYAFTFTALAAAVGLNIGLAPLISKRLGLDYPIQAVLYLLMAPTSFFLPLWQAHREMVRSRNRIIDSLSNQYQSEYNRLLLDVGQNDQSTEDRLKRLKSIQEAYEITLKSWTWPFETSTLYKAVITILAPFSLAVLQVLQGYASDWVTKLFGGR